MKYLEIKTLNYQNKSLDFFEKKLKIQNIKLTKFFNMAYFS